MVPMHSSSRVRHSSSTELSSPLSLTRPRKSFGSWQTATTPTSPTEIGQEGAGHISKAIALGVVKHPELAVADNQWYTSVPTVLPNTSVENEKIGGYTELKEKFSQQKDGENVLVNMIINGYSAIDSSVNSAEGAAEYVAGSWSGKQYLGLKEAAWQRDLAYYQSLGN